MITVERRKRMEALVVIIVTVLAELWPDRL